MLGAAAAASTIVGGIASVATIATVASVASGVLSLAAGLTAKKPTAAATGSQTQFAADPDAGIPCGIGRTGTAGNIVARFGWDTRDAGDNDRQGFVSVLSLGPVKEIEPALGVDRVPVNFDSQGRAIGSFAGFMWRTTQVGMLASAALTFGAGAGSPPAWGAQHGLSGKAATTWTLRFDTKSKLYQNGVPAPMNVLKGQFCYDPRKDSTYPGGSGSHRMADPADRAAYDAAVATWEWSECPYLNGLRFVHGYWQRDMANPSSEWQRVMGMGAPLAGIDVASFVEGANIADANGWKAGGMIYSGDDKWASLKKILQAGMGEPLALGAKISCLVNAPKVSLATITVDDIIGDCSVGATQPRRDRLNTITPRFRLEANNWQLLPGAPISVREHIIADRGKRSATRDYPMIQSTPQVGTAVRYDIENGREFGPIVLPCKLVWMGYKPGDCITAELPEVGLVNQPILLLNRSLAPASAVVTLTARSETPGKHPFALGQTATPPPTPGVTGAPIVPVPGVDAWAVTGGSVAADGVTLAALTIAGTVAASAVDGVIFDYRPFVSGQADEAGWIAAGTEAVDVTRKVITGVRDLAPYEVSVRYSARGFSSRRRVLGPVTTGAATVSWGDGVVGPHKPADDATNSADPTSPFGHGGTVGGTIKQLTDIDRAIAAAKAREDTLVNDTIPAIDRAVQEAADRIGDVRDRADAAYGRADQAISNADTVNRRVDQLIAEGGGGSEGVDTVARSEIRRVEEAAIGRDDAAARTVDTLRASYLSGAGNLLTNSDFVTLDGWRLTYNGVGASLYRNFPNDLWYPIGENVLCLNQGSGPNGGGYCQVESDWFGVTGGTAIQVYAFTAAHRCDAAILAAFYDSNGSPIGDSGGVTAPRRDGGRNPANWDQTGQKFFTVPTGAVTARLLLRKSDTAAGATDSIAWFWRPYVSLARPSQTSWNPYAVGSAKAVQLAADARVTREVTALALADQALARETAVVEARLNGNITASVRDVTTAFTIADDALAERSRVLEAAVLTGPDRNARLAARITDNETVLTDLPNSYATAQSVQTLQAQVNFAADSGLQRTINARIEDRATVIADSKAGAVAETVRVLRGEYDGTTAEVREQRGVINGLNGKTAAYVRFIADAGNGRGIFSLWSDQYGGAWQLGGNGLIDGNVVVNGTITALAFNGPSMYREGQSSWSGNVSPGLGQTVSVGWSLGLPVIPAGRGRFIYEATFEIATNAGTIEYGGIDGQGRSVRTYYVADGGGLILQAVDGQGNVYAARPNASDRVLATTDFAPTFTAFVRRGSRNETQDGGDYVNHYVAATYTLTRISLKVLWAAV